MTLNYNNICTKCGACCKKTSVDAYNGFLINFYEKLLNIKLEKLQTKKNGDCINLLDDNSCAIYEDRPLICRYGNDKLHIGPNTLQDLLKYTEREYVDLQMNSCNALMHLNKIDKSYHIKLDDEERVKKNAAKMTKLTQSLLFSKKVNFMKSKYFKSILKKAIFKKTWQENKK